MKDVSVFPRELTCPSHARPAGGGSCWVLVRSAALLNLWMGLAMVENRFQSFKVSKFRNPHRARRNLETFRNLETLFCSSRLTLQFLPRRGLGGSQARGQHAEG